MTEFVIKKGIPAPARRNKGGPGRKALYPFAEMDVGDCFDAPRDMGSNGPRDKRANSINTAARDWSIRNNPMAVFQTCLVNDAFVRCWRIG